VKLRIAITRKEAAAAARSIDVLRQFDEVQVADALVVIARRVLAACPELFPRKKAGICFVCGCSQDDACPGGCSWVDRSHSLCSVCVFTDADHPDAPIPYRITELGQRTLRKHRKAVRS
jgi:hypothetical protein